MYLHLIHESLKANTKFKSLTTPASSKNRLLSPKPRSPETSYSPSSRPATTPILWGLVPWTWRLAISNWRLPLRRPGRTAQSPRPRQNWWNRQARRWHKHDHRSCTRSIRRRPKCRQLECCCPAIERCCANTNGAACALPFCLSGFRTRLPKPARRESGFLSPQVAMVVVKASFSFWAS